MWSHIVLKPRMFIVNHLLVQQKTLNQSLFPGVRSHTPSYLLLFIERHKGDKVLAAGGQQPLLMFRPVTCISLIVLQRICIFYCRYLPIFFSVLKVHLFACPCHPDNCILPSLDQKSETVRISFFDYNDGSNFVDTLLTHSDVQSLLISQLTDFFQNRKQYTGYNRTGFHLLPLILKFLNLPLCHSADFRPDQLPRNYHDFLVPPRFRSLKMAPQSFRNFLVTH